MSRSEINLNSSLKYIQSIKDSLPFTAVDNCRAPYCHEETGEMGFFFGRIAYRIAGCTDDFEAETAKKQFRRLAEKFHQVTVEVDQQKKLVFLAEEAVSTLEGKLFSPNNFEIFQSSVSFLRMVARNNVVLLRPEMANKLNLLLVVMQNSMDLVIETFLAATASTHAARIYRFYVSLVDAAIRSLDKVARVKFGRRSSPVLTPLQRDQERLAKLRVPYLLATFMYNRNISNLLAESLFDHSAEVSGNADADIAASAPYLESVECRSEPVFGRDKNLNVCFEMERWVRARETLFGAYSEKDADGVADADAGSSSVDVRHTVLSALQTEPYRFRVPRKHVCAQVLTFAIALHLCVWTWKISRECSYSKLEELQFALQMLHPAIGMNTILFNHVHVLIANAEAVSEILYGCAACGDPQDFFQLVSSLIHACSLPTLSQQRSSFPSEQQAEPAGRDIARLFASVARDFEPFIEEYFSLSEAPAPSSARQFSTLLSFDAVHQPDVQAFVNMISAGNM